MKKTQLLLKLLSSVAVSMLLSACGASMKPDHPQVYESFKDRRVPKENAFLEQGTTAPTHRKTNFRAYTGRTFESKAENKGQVEVQNSGLQDSSQRNSQTDVNNVQGQTQHIQNQAPAEDKAAKPSFWNRLQDKFSSLTTSAPEHVMVAERKRPIENVMQMAQAQEAPEHQIAQGSTNSYSYYDSADEIIPASPVYSIKEEKLAVIMLLAANTNSSAPLVDIPEPESYSTLRDEGKLNNKPDLKSVPQVPKKKADKAEVKPKPVIEKPKQAEDATMLNQPELDHDYDYVNEAGRPVAEYEGQIQDNRAEIVYQDGQRMLMGSIGTIRTSMVN